MALLTREQLEQRRQRAYREVDVPSPDPVAAANGETVTIRLRSMFGGEWVDLIRSLQNNEWRSKNYTQLVLAFCLVDEQNKRLLSDEDINSAWWKTQSKGFMLKAIDEAMKLSNLSSDMTVEESAKNLPEIGGSGNSTGLPIGSDTEPPEIASTTWE